MTQSQPAVDTNAGQDAQSGLEMREGEANAANDQTDYSRDISQDQVGTGTTDVPGGQPPEQAPPQEQSKPKKKNGG